MIPGFEKIKEIDNSRKEFHIEGRILHNPEFSTSMSKAKFKVCSIPAVRENSQNRFTLMTVRSEGQFNTVVYDTEDRYRGISGRNVVMINEKDMEKLNLREGNRVTVKNETGEMTGQKVSPTQLKKVVL